ncbi:Src protein [Planoprotostelium fungivorum]|uniref:Src protein n=1 Tax=Planoprotostelium fungivorum TaxID=1890364 RepID=A0A2P6NN81_9EUKA|nr:Src protein [Planoprotostelium fungivorum]
MRLLRLQQKHDSHHTPVTLKALRPSCTGTIPPQPCKESFPIDLRLYRSNIETNVGWNMKLRRNDMEASAYVYNFDPGVNRGERRPQLTWLLSSHSLWQRVTKEMMRLLFLCYWIALSIAASCEQTVMKGTALSTAWNTILASNCTDSSVTFMESSAIDFAFSVPNKAAPITSLTILSASGVTISGSLSLPAISQVTLNGLNYQASSLSVNSTNVSITSSSFSNTSITLRSIGSVYIQDSTFLSTTSASPSCNNLNISGSNFSRHIISSSCSLSISSSTFIGSTLSTASASIIDTQMRSTSVSSSGPLIMVGGSVADFSSTSTSALSATLNLQLNRVTFYNNTGKSGGAASCTFLNNRAINSGGALHTTGYITDSSSNFTGNSASISGGAVYAYSLSLYNSTFVLCNSNSGGAASHSVGPTVAEATEYYSNVIGTSANPCIVYGSSLVMTKSDVYNNTGAALYSQSSVRLTDSTFTNNYSPSTTVVSSSSALVTRCTFLRNFGTSVLYTSSGVSTTKDSIFEKNTIYANAAIYSLAGTTSTNCTFVDNFASNYNDNRKFYLGDMDSTGDTVLVSNRFQQNRTSLVLRTGTYRLYQNTFTPSPSSNNTVVVGSPSTLLYKQLDELLQRQCLPAGSFFTSGLLLSRLLERTVDFYFYPKAFHNHIQDTIHDINDTIDDSFHYLFPHRNVDVDIIRHTDDIDDVIIRHTDDDDINDIINAIDNNDDINDDVNDDTINDINDGFHHCLLPHHIVDIIHSVDVILDINDINDDIVHRIIDYIIDDAINSINHNVDDINNIIEDSHHLYPQSIVDIIYNVVTVIPSTIAPTILSDQGAQSAIDTVASGNKSITYTDIYDVMSSLFNNDTSSNPVVISSPSIAVTAYDIRRPTINGTVVAVDLAAGGNDTVSTVRPKAAVPLNALEEIRKRRLILGMTVPALVVFMQYNYKTGGFQVEKPANNTAAVYGLTLTDSKGGVVEVSNSTSRFVITMPTSAKSPRELNESVCLYLDVRLGQWLTDGCTTERNYTAYTITCHCDHLTNFTAGAPKKNTAESPISIATPVSTSSSNGKAIIIGAVIGSIAFVAIIALVLSFIIIRRRRNANRANVEDLSLDMYDHKLDIEIREKIGGSSVSTVYKCLQQGMTNVAVKRIHNQVDKRHTQNEIFILKSVHHPHVVQYLNSYVGEEGQLCVMFEFMEQNLHQRLRDDRQPPLLVRENALQVVKALSYLESCHIVHCNVSAKHVLLTDKLAKLCDFGMAIMDGRQVDANISDDRVPVRWSSPEVLVKRQFSAASDIWAFGILLWEIMHDGELPYADMNDMEVRDYVLSGDRLPTEGNTSDTNVMAGCWRKSPNNRMSLKEITLLLEFKPRKRSSHSCSQLSSEDEDDRQPEENALESEGYVTTTDYRVRPREETTSEALVHSGSSNIYSFSQCKTMVPCKRSADLYSSQRTMVVMLRYLEVASFTGGKRELESVKLGQRKAPNFRTFETLCVTYNSIMPVIPKEGWNKRRLDGTMAGETLSVTDEEVDKDPKRQKIEEENNEEDLALLDEERNIWTARGLLNYSSDIPALSERMISTQVLHLRGGSDHRLRYRWHDMMDSPGLYSNWPSLRHLLLDNWNDSEEYLSTGRMKTLMVRQLKKLSIRNSRAEWAEWVPWLKASPNLTHLVLEGCIPGEKLSNGDGACMPQMKYLKIDHLAISSSQFSIASKKIGANLRHLDLTLELATRRYKSIEILDSIGNHLKGLVSLRVVFGVDDEECSNPEPANKAAESSFNKGIRSVSSIPKLSYLSLEAISPYFPLSKVNSKVLSNLISTHDFHVCQIFQRVGKEIEDSFKNFADEEIAKAAQKKGLQHFFFPGMRQMVNKQPISPWSPYADRMDQV